MVLRIYADFNTMTIDGEMVRIRKDGYGQTDSDVAKHLHPDLRIVLYDEEMEVEATIEGQMGEVLLCRPDWSTRHYFACP